MEIRIRSKHIITMIVGLSIVLLDFILFFGTNSRLFRPLIALGLFIASLQFWLDILRENKRQREIELKFIEFVRALVETVRSGIPIPKAILSVSKADYGALSPYIKKLANQIEWGIPLHDALKNFSFDSGNKVIKRSIAIVIEAEESGGNIDQVLQSVSNSVVQIRRLKDDRKSEVYSQLVQGYFVFFIFIGTMLVLQIYLLPQLTDIADVLVGFKGGSFESLLSGTEEKGSTINMSTLFIWLILIQGFFAGVMIGKFSEGELKAGLKHSLILMIVGYIVFTFVGGA